MESDELSPLSDLPVSPEREALGVTVLAPSVFKYRLALGGSAWLLTLALMALGRGHLNSRMLLFSLIAPALSVPLARSIRTMFAIVVSSRGIEGRNSRGRRTRADWNETHVVSVRRVLGFLHIEILTPRMNRPLQVSVAKVKPEDLIAAVKFHAGPKHPLVPAYEAVLRRAHHAPPEVAS